MRYAHISIPNVRSLMIVDTRYHGMAAVEYNCKKLVDAGCKPTVTFSTTWKAA